ncbi:MAG: glycosyltransferase family 4 protein [Chlamydiota bacterium]
MKRVLHTESSRGWGGQEIRILREAEGMRARGHEIFFAANVGAKLIPKARAAGFIAYEIPFAKPSWPKSIYRLMHIVSRHKIDLINTHSSLDAWVGGIVARLCKKKVIRTRHLSTPIRKGLNSRLLYKTLADHVVTTSSSILSVIEEQAGLAHSRLCCIPTGIEPSQVQADLEESQLFRKIVGAAPSDILVGTACFVRSWKGIDDLLKAAVLLKEHKQIKWVIVGGGHVDDYRPKIAQMNLEGTVVFTGHLEPPFAAIQAMDIFTLLSTAHEGISQASLQAAYLRRPLITTTIGGLPEVCLDGITGWVVPPFSPQAIADAVLKLSQDAALRRKMGDEAHQLVTEKFMIEHTLDQMQQVYATLS